MQDLVRESVYDMNIDPLIAKFIEDSGLEIRGDEKYFIIRSARKTREIDYKLSESQVENLGGEASLKKAELKAKNLAYLKERHVIKQKFEKPMRVMYLWEEVKIKKENGRVKVIH